MKKLYPLFLALLPLLYSADQGQNELVEITVVVEGLSAAKGQLRLGVYDQAAHFPDEKKQVLGRVEKVLNSTVRLSMRLAKNKAYAFAAYHDANGNGRLDKNLLGMPEERYGFSNAARGTFSAPSFSAAQIYVKGQQQIKILLE